MLPKKNRVDTKTVEQIFQRGRSISSPNLNFKYILSGKEKRISFIAPKSVAKLAVKRNLLRRRGYSALVKHIKGLTLGVAGVFIFKKAESNIKTLENEIQNILHKIN